jgi:hypothetical protein
MRAWRRWGFKPVRAHTPLLVEGPCALSGGVSFPIGRSYDQRADLTSRFIKFLQPIIFVSDQKSVESTSGGPPSGRPTGLIPNTRPRRIPVFATTWKTRLRHNTSVETGSARLWNPICRQHIGIASAIVSPGHDHSRVNIQFVGGNAKVVAHICGVHH